MKNKKAVIIIEIFLCSLLVFGIYSLSHYVYADVYDVTIPISVIISYIVVSMINLKKESKNLRHKFRYFTVILFVITFIFILSTKPVYTYHEGIGIAKDNDFDNVSVLSTKSILSFNLERNYFITNSYLYIGEKNNQKLYLLLSPINGEIETFDYEGNNYISRYFELKGS
ncbi:MAG: hypothetical protein ACOCRO_09515 [Halanaerobiales bacterium]